MNALGLIETRGLVSLVHALDAMLKAAQVSPAGPLVKIDAGLVSLMVKGDVSSVRAAVEAGAEAARQTGELVSAHVIPRPDASVLKIFTGGAAR
jgi:ethanolamine utilization protein EutM